MDYLKLNKDTIKAVPARELVNIKKELNNKLAMAHQGLEVFDKNEIKKFIEIDGLINSEFKKRRITPSKPDKLVAGKDYGKFKSPLIEKIEKYLGE